MTRRTRRGLTLGAVLMLGVLAWPGPAGADTTLGGYSGSASAQPVRIQIYEPTIPIPSTPQIDLGVGYTQVSTDTGPVSRALASYLWPGPVLGDGFGTVVGNDAAKYPIQVNSRTPATAEAPARNTAQLTEGNGMTTSSSPTDTHATVTGAGVAGPDTDLLGGLGQGLGQLGGSSPSSAKPTTLPVPVSGVLGALATVSAVSSTSDVTLGTSGLVSTAHAHLGTVSLLAGLVTINGVDITATSTSNGTTSTNRSTVDLAGLTVAGVKLDLDEKGLDLAGSSVALPKVPAADVLQRLGISIKATQAQRTHTGPTASFAAQGLTVSLDTVPLKTLLNVSALTDPLAQALAKIPNLGSQVGPLLGLGPKIVLQLGSVDTAATAAPAYTGGGAAPGASPTGTTAGGRSTGAVASTGGGSLTGGAVGGGGGTGANGGGGPAATGGATTSGTVPAASSGYTLPPLGAVPKGLILGGLVLAGLAAWGLRGVGVLLFGPPGGCDEGLASGVPDLRTVR